MLLHFHAALLWLLDEEAVTTADREFVPETPWSKTAEQDELSEQRKCTMEVLLRLSHHCESC